MQRPLDPLRFKENVYERPNQEWVCGHTAEGRACPLGPDARGNCRHTGECFPARRGDRWSCTRSEAQGGKCAEGPLPHGACAHPIPPCQPVRSLRKARALYVWTMVALTAGALLILFGGWFRHAWMDPGPLTNAHAPSAAKCSDCHSANPAGQQFASISFSHNRQSDNALCVKCHQLGPQPFQPHSLAPAILAEKRRQLTASNESKLEPVFLRISRTLTTAHAESGDLACATCHQEHHGRTFDLTRLSDAQCQACHAVQFASFAKGHPEFSGYPYRRRTRIFFDHASHLEQHFAARKEQAPVGCQSCHVPGPAGRLMLVKNFNVSCASCHSAQIKGEGMTTKGVAFFRVPGLDAETLAERGHSVGEWPRFADGKLTPFMELLLDREPAARAALAQLHGVDLLDLQKATPEQLTAAEQFAWAVKSLLFHLVVEGQSYLLKEMKDEIEPAGLEVPRAALIAAQKEWMPHLLTEVRDYQKGIKPAPPEKAKPPPAVSPTPAASEKSTSGDESLLAGGEDLLAAPAASPAKPAASPGEDLLVGGEEDLLSAAASPTPTPSEEGDLLGDTDLLGGAPAASPSPTAPTPAPTPEMMPAEEWVAAGGWYRPQDSFTLFYRPVGHADPFLVAWLNAAAHLQAGAFSTEEASPFQRLADPQSPGLCMKCHTAERDHDTLQVNWRPAHPDPATRPFTTFSHTTHFSLVGDAGCQTCHSLNSKAQYAKFFARENNASETRWNPTQFESNFAPIAKTLCAQCHQPRIAGDGCIVCHRYHANPAKGGLVDVGHFRPPPTTIPTPEPQSVGADGN